MKLSDGGSKPRKVKVKAHTRTIRPRQPKPDVFGLLGRADAPITKARSQAHEQTSKALRKSQARVIVPAIPKLKNPTPEQRHVAVNIVARSLKAQGVDTPQKVAALPPSQRKRVSRAQGYARTAAKYEFAARSPQPLTSVGSLSDMAALGREVVKQTQGQVKAKPEPKHSHFGGQTKIAGIGIPGLHQALYSTGRILEQFNRPLHAVAGASIAASRGEPIGKAALQGLENKTHYTASDVLKEHGGTGSGIADAIVGFGGDLALNPLNWAGGGVRPVAEGLVSDAQNFTRLAEQAKEAGNMAKASRYAARAEKAAQKAASAPTNRGIRIGLNVGRHGHYTSGATSARVLGKLGSTHAGATLHDSRLGQWAGHVFIPGFRPKDVPLAEWRQYREITDRARAHVRSSTKAAERRGFAFARATHDAVKKGEGDAIVAGMPVHGLERAPLDPLAAHETRQAILSAPRDIPAARTIKSDIQARVEKARQAVRDATAERVRAERTHSDTLQGAGVLHGRAQILSRNVGGVKAEKLAQRTTPLKIAEGKPHTAQFAAGAHGVHDAATTLQKSAAAVRGARAAEKAAQKDLEAVLRRASKDRRSLTKALPDLAASHAEATVRALPSHSVESLPPMTRAIAEGMRKEFASALAREHAVGAGTKTRMDYVPHQWPKTVEETRGGIQRLAAGGNPFDDARTIPGSIAEINAGRAAETGKPLFSTNPAALVAHRLTAAGRAEGKALINHELVAQGVARPVEDAAKLKDLKETDNLYTLTDEGLKPLQNAHGEPDLVKARQAIRQGDRVVAMHHQIGDQFVKGALGKGALANVYHAGEPIDRFLAGMRSTFTVLNWPAYDLRNLTGDLWNSWLAGTKSSDVRDGFRLMRDQMARHKAESHDLNVTWKSSRKYDIGGGKKVTGDELLQRMEKAGAIQTGYFGGQRFEEVHGVENHGVMVVGTGGKIRKGAGKVGEKVGGVGGQVAAEHPVEALRSIGQIREDFVRAGTFLGAKRRGMSDTQAAAWSNKHHFDYTDLTSAERTFLRRAFLFWTFPARNTPLQASRALSNPRPFAAYQSAREEGAKYAGLPPNWEHTTADYQQRGAGIPFKVGGAVQMAYPGAPLTDLSRIGALLSPRDEGKLTIAALNPAGKVPLELLSNHNFFFDSPIQRSGRNQTEANARHWVPAPPALAKIPGVRDILGMHLIEDKKAGKPIWKMSALADYLIRTTPQGGLGLQAFTPNAGSRGQTSAQKLLSRSGVNIGPYDAKKNTVNMLFNALNHFTAARNDAKDLHGKDSPEYKVLSTKIKQTTAQLKALGAISDTRKRKKRSYDPTSGGGGAGGYAPSGTGAGPYGP